MKKVKSKNSYMGNARLGWNVAKAREQAGLSQLELGLRINADQATISRMESGKLSGNKIQKIAAIAETTGKLWLLDSLCSECDAECTRKRMSHRNTPMAR